MFQTMPMVPGIACLVGATEELTNTSTLQFILPAKKCELSRVSLACEQVDS